MPTYANASSRPTGWRRILSWTLQALVGAAFLAAGGAKLAGVEHLVQLFDQIGFGQWLRYLTAALEITGGVLVLIPRTAFVGSLLLICIMLGALLTHLLLIGGNSAPAAMLLAGGSGIAWLRRPAKIA